MVSIRNDLKALCSECGAPMTEGDLVMRECAVCHAQSMEREVCENGHFVCDACRNKATSRFIYKTCSKSDSKDPIALAMEIMSDRRIRMHDMRHHVLVACCLLTAYKNCGGDIDLDKALKDADKRGSWFPAGICGLCGTCGAAASTGIFYSIISGTSPHSKGSWKDTNRMTSLSLHNVSEIDGPRCCKRNSFISILTACDYAEEKMGIKMEPTRKIECQFTERNEECIGKDCPFHP